MKSSELQRKIAEHCPVTRAPEHPRIRKVRQIFESFKLRKKILDVGCADGSVLEPFLGRHELHGVDISPEYLEGAIKAGYQARLHDLENDPLPYPDASFDVVYTGETIEHQVDTDWFLAEINRVLKSDGCLVLTFPNVRTPVSLAMMAFADLPPMYSARYRSAHYRDFTLRTMEIALTNHGFGIEAVIGTHFYFPGFGDVLSGLASWLPRWASQIVIKAQKTAMSRYSAKEAASVDIYNPKKN